MLVQNAKKVNNMLIKLDKSIIESCEAFAEACAVTNKYYASRGQSNLEKIKNDIKVGKMGEWAAYQLLIDKGYEVAKPDHEIYTGSRKSHSADLEGSGFKFSVKTQTLDSVRKYGMSWLMEKNSIPKFKEHFFILCLQISDNEILIQNLVPFADMTKNVGAPRLSYLNTKAAFYYNDIICEKLKG